MKIKNWSKTGRSATEDVMLGSANPNPGGTKGIKLWLIDQNKDKVMSLIITLEELTMLKDAIERLEKSTANAN